MGSPRGGAAGGSPWAPHALWIAPIAALLLVDLVIAPRRGALWCSDYGFYLMRSWNAAHGFGLDRSIVPQDPSYLFNAALMRLGISGLLAFRQAANLFTFISAGAFFLALDPLRFRSPLVPMALCASLLVSLTSVSNPASLSFGFFMLGAAFLFLHIDDPTRPWHGALGGLCLALAGFMHAAVALVRFGLVTLAVAVFTTDSIGNLPITFNPSIWYFWGPIFVMASVILLAVWAFRAATAGRKLFAADLFE